MVLTDEGIPGVTRGLPVTGAPHEGDGVPEARHYVERLAGTAAQGKLVQPGRDARIGPVALEPAKQLNGKVTKIPGKQDDACDDGVDHQKAGKNNITCPAWKEMMPTLR